VDQGQFLTSSSAISRRRLLLAGAGFAAALLAGVAPVLGQGGIIVLSRERLLREATASRQLAEAETALTEQLQGQIDTTKEALAEEEEELARLRGRLPEAEFEARTADFDRRVRQARRVAQERAAILQTEFQEARATILGYLPELIERLRAETGASLVLDAEQVLARDDAVDVTDRGIALFDSEGPAPEVPEIDLSAPLLEPKPTDAEKPTRPDPANTATP